MKNVEVTINPTEIRSVKYNNAFSKKTGEKIALSVKSEASIKLNPANPVVAIVVVKISVEDPDKSMQMEIETITGITVSTFIDNFDQFIKNKYLPIIIMSVNEKVRSLSAIMGAPIKVPNPKFATPCTEDDAPSEYMQ